LDGSDDSDDSDDSDGSDVEDAFILESLVVAVVLCTILESSEKKSIDFSDCCVFNLECNIKCELCIINKIKSLYIIILIIWRQKKNGEMRPGIYFILFRSK
jgi:hypothetical protein